METLIDPVFGKVTYTYGWSKELVLKLWDENINLRVTASAYKGQKIDEYQRSNASSLQ